MTKNTTTHRKPDILSRTAEVIATATPSAATALMPFSGQNDPSTPPPPGIVTHN